MNPIVHNFLEQELLAALTTLRKDGLPHSSVMRFSHDHDADGGLVLYYLTPRHTRKVERITDPEHSEHKAAVVIGFDDNKWISFQASGDIAVADTSVDVERIKESHFAKHPSSREHDNENMILLVFKPRWWRLLDLSTTPHTVIEIE